MNVTTTRPAKSGTFDTRPRRTFKFAFAGTIFLLVPLFMSASMETIAQSEQPGTANASPPVNPETYLRAGFDHRNSGRFSQAAMEFRKAAEAGHPVAMHRLGDMYLLGHGVPQNIREATKWIGAAAVRGFPEAQFVLGHMHMTGAGVPPDPEIATYLYRSAAERGHAPAQRELGLIYSVGLQHENFGIPPNSVRAAEWFQRAAEQGDARAQYQFGLHLFNGKGADMNREEAVKWFRTAARQCHVPALTMMGFAYANGYGTVKHRPTAYAFYNIASVSGYKDALEGRKYMESLLDNIETNEATKLLEKSFESQYANCG